MGVDVLEEKMDGTKVLVWSMDAETLPALKQLKIPHGRDVVVAHKLEARRARLAQ